MGKKQNWNDIGEQIRSAVQDSLSTGDFRQLNEIISGTVNSAITEAKRQVEQSVNINWDGTQSGKKTYSTGQVYQSGETRPLYQAGENRNPYTERQSARGRNPYASQSKTYNPYKETRPATAKNSLLPRIKMNKVGDVSGVLYMVFGGIGTGLTAIAAMVLMIVLLAGGAVGLFIPLFIVGALLVCFILMIERGCMKKDRLKRAKRYIELCGDKSYIDIEDLALHMGKSKRHILKDVKKMIRLGIFPEGHLDAQESCLILDDATFRQYLTLQKERKALELEEKVAKMQERQKASGQQILEAQKEEKKEEAAKKLNQAAAEEEAENPQLAAMIREGQDYIRRLRDVNDVIEGEVISNKLFRLENLLKEIFDRVKEHPEQMPQMRKFMEYYLPTTLKLVEAYADFDSVSVPGEDIITAKEEIEKTLDTINQAFVELLNKLYRESVFDVTTDAQVLQTMLAKEGLTREKEFEKLPR